MPSGRSCVGHRRHLRRELLPAGDAGHPAGAGHDDVLAADDLIELDRLLQAVGRERRRAVVRRAALDAQVVEQLAHVLRRRGRPVEVRRVELDDLVAHLRNGGHGAGQILRQLGPHRIELEPDRHVFCIARRARTPANGAAPAMARNARRETSQCDHARSLDTARRRFSAGTAPPERLARRGRTAKRSRR